MLINNPPGYKEYLKSIGYDDDNARKQARVYENAHDIAQIILQHSDSFEWKKPVLTTNGMRHVEYVCRIN